MENQLTQFELNRKHPVRTFEIWMTPDGNTRGYELFQHGWPESIRGYDISHNCFGKKASICIVSNDKRITRHHAIHFATCIVLDKMKAFRISTEGL